MHFPCVSRSALRKAIPLENNPMGKQRTSLYVQIQELVHIFRYVEDKWGAPVVNERKLKSWVKRNGFGR